MSQTKKIALIVAGGSGKRMGENIPKQFLLIKGKPVLMHTIELFYNFDPNIEIIVVLPELQINVWEKLCAHHSFSVDHKNCVGGETRFLSVKNGLKEIKEDGIVFIHDGVRPLVSINTLNRCFNMALEKGNAIPVIPVTESLRKTENNKNVSVDRSKYFLVQTPQTFRFKDINVAYKMDYSPKFTDDASVIEASGGKINLVEGNRENIKITYPDDIIKAQSY